MVGAVEVRHGDGVGVAEEEPAGHVLGHLVDGGGGEDAAGAEGGEQDTRIEGAGHGVDVGVAQDDADGVRAVPVHDGAQPGRDGVEGLLPRRLAQYAVLAHERGAQSVGIAVGRAEGGALGAEEPLAEHVLAVAAGAGHPGPLDGERQPAGGLAEGAHPQGGTGARRGGVRRDRVRRGPGEAGTRRGAWGAGVSGGACGAGHGSSRRTVAAVAHGRAEHTDRYG